MTQKDSMNGMHITRVVSPVSIGDDTASVGVITDTEGYNSLTYAIAMGSLADTDATFAILVEHSDVSDLTGSVVVPDDMLVGTEALAGFAFGDDDETRKIGYIGDKRYVRLTLTPTDNTGAAVVCVIAILGEGAHQPEANPPV